MTPALRKGLLVALLHVAIVASLGAKLMVDRATRPRVWARTAPVDPDLPIRGRYVRLQIEVDGESNLRSASPQAWNPVELRVTTGGSLRCRRATRASTRVWLPGTRATCWC